MIQYVFQIKTLSRDTPIFQTPDWLRNERDNKVEIRCSMSITKYGDHIEIILKIRIFGVHSAIL